MSQRKKRRKRKTRRWGCLFCVELLIALLLIPVLFIFSKLSLVQTADSSEVNVDNIVVNDDMDAGTQESLDSYRVIAFFGVDSRDGTLDDGTRSDSIIIASINKKTKAVKIASVYRDTCMYVPGHGYTKATHAYAYGGAELAISMLNINLDLNITEFATVDFGILAEIIDALGGVEIDVTEAEYNVINALIDEQNRVTGSDSEHLTTYGKQLLNGTQATAYARIRKIDSDFQRAQRQRTVLSKMFAKAKSAGPITLVNLVNTVMPEVYTNLSQTDMLVMSASSFAFSLEDQTGYPFNYTTGYLSDGLNYVFAVGFEDNVSQLHAWLFDDDEYVA